MKAWSASDAELQEAASYFAGVCADFIPQNPGICTNVPSTITLSPVPVPTNQANAPAPQPMTIVQVVNTVTITKGGDKQPKTSVMTQVITVPQVQFVTATQTPALTEGGAPAPAPTPSVGLIPVQTYATTTTSITLAGVAAGTNSYSHYTVPSASASFTKPATFTGGAGKKEIGFGAVAGVLAIVAFLA